MANLTAPIIGLPRTDVDEENNKLRYHRWMLPGIPKQGEVRRNAANGCVMRTSVGSIPYFWDEEKVIDNCRKWGMITHYDPRSRAAVIVTVLILSKLLQGRDDVEKIIEEAIQRGEKELNENEIKDMHKYVYAKEWEELNLSYSQGYCWKPVGCAILTLKKAIEMKKNGMNDKQIFSDCLDNIVHQAGDADTNGCVTGACLGAYLKGICIPDGWMELKHMNWLKERINRMLRLYELEPMEI
jgi:ADP-ribosylglycohydrolase